MTGSRIISLVPSLTELLFDLGLGPQVIGRTRFCIHPAEKVAEVPIIGGTKNPRIEKIQALNPDWVVANKEENNKADVEAIQAFCRVHITEINTVSEGLRAIGDIGRLFKRRSNAEHLIRQIESELDDIPRVEAKRAAYFIWRDPWMTAASGTYINDIMRRWGLENVYESEDRYPETTLEELARRKPEMILLSSEPYPFKEKHIAEIKAHCPDATIELVDGEWFSWYGSRMLPAFAGLNKWRPAVV